jgi:hypothetical protein
MPSESGFLRAQLIRTVPSRVIHLNLDVAGYQCRVDPTILRSLHYDKEFHTLEHGIQQYVDELKCDRFGNLPIESFMGR